MQENELSAKTLFRENAINSLNNVSEEIQACLKIVNVTSAGLIFALILALLAVVVWGVWGKVSITIPGSGIILAAEDLQRSENRLADSLKDRKEKMLFLEHLYAKKIKLYQKHYLTIVDLEKAKEEYQAAKEDLANVTKGNYLNISKPVFVNKPTSRHADLEALVFISHDEGKKVAVGMMVYLLPSTLSLFQYGYIMGEVINVSEYPASKESVYSYLGNMNLVDEFFMTGVPYLVKIKLIKNIMNKSGLEWTSKLGSPFQIEPGATLTANIISKNCSPLQLLIQQCQ